MIDTKKFKDVSASGQWVVRFNGKNVSSPNPINFGSVFYEYAQMKITYTV